MHCQPEMVFMLRVIGDLEVRSEALKTKEPKEGISEFAEGFSNRTVTHMQCSTGSTEPETHRPFSRLSVLVACVAGSSQLLSMGGCGRLWRSRQYRETFFPIPIRASLIVLLRRT